MRYRLQPSPTIDHGATCRSFIGRRSLAVVLLTCGFLMIGATPGLGDSIASEAEACEESESIECLADFPTAAQRRRDTACCSALVLATRGGETVPQKRRTAAAPLHGRRLANGDMAPLRL